MPAYHVLQGEAHSADDDSSVVIAWGGGLGTAAAYGTWSSATMTFEVSYDNGITYFAIGSDTTLTVDGHGNFDLPEGVLLRGTSSGGAGSVALTLEILPRRPIA